MNSTSLKLNQDKIERPDVFRYHDYRTFLKDWSEYLKCTKPGFSLRTLAREAGLGSGYLSMVIHGKRNLSAKTWAKVAPLLVLTPKEKSYLDSLRVIEETTSPVVRIEAYKKLHRFRSYREMNPKETQTYKYLSHWYNVVIREMVFLPGFRFEAEWIQEHLGEKVPLSEIRQALTFLKENGFVEVDENGQPKVLEKNIECFGSVYRNALSHFHAEMLGLAKKAVEEVDVNKRNVTGHTFAISTSDFTKVRNILDNALKEISLLENSEKPTSVYHVSLAFFPVANTSVEGGQNENE